MSAVAHDFDASGHLLPQAHSRFPAAAKGAKPAEAAPKAPLPYPLAPRPTPKDLILDHGRDVLLTDFGKATLKDR